MLTEISTIITSLNTARQLGTAILDLKQAEAVRDAVSELKDKIGEAQDGLFRVGQERSDLAEKVRELESKLAGFERWTTEEARYELTALAPNVMAMRLRSDISTTEPDHLLCADCFAQRKKLYLTMVNQAMGFYRFKCNGCGSDLSYVKPDERARSPRQQASDPWL